jgi:hypothetical protein
MVKTEEGWPHEQPLPDVPMHRQIVELNRRVAELEEALAAICKPIIPLYEFANEQIKFTEADNLHCCECYSQLDDGGAHEPNCIVNLINAFDAPLRSIESLKGKP